MHVLRLLVKRLKSGSPTASALHCIVKAWSPITRSGKPFSTYDSKLTEVVRRLCNMILTRKGIVRRPRYSQRVPRAVIIQVRK